jgi:hypothetical protein
MLEPNRFRALLLQRALANRLPDAIIVRFASVEPALDELQQGAYAGAIINLDSLTVAQADRLTVELQDNSSIAVILRVSSETSRRSVVSAIAIRDSVLINVSADAGETANQLALRLLHTQSQSSGRSNQPPTNQLQLTLSGE